MSNQIVPLTTSPNQTMTVNLSIDGTTKELTLGIHWNSFGPYWTMDMSDPATGNPILLGIPLLCAAYPAANILAPYAYLAIGSAYVIPASSSPSTDSPDDTNLGTDFYLIWGDTP